MSRPSNNAYSNGEVMDVVAYFDGLTTFQRPFGTGEVFFTYSKISKRAAFSMKCAVHKNLDFYLNFWLLGRPIAVLSGRLATSLSRSTSRPLNLSFFLSGDFFYFDPK